MHIELPVLSFTCAVLLAALLPLKHLRTGIANFTIIFWLLICNIIHGVNNIVWAGNDDVHIPLWCDTATNVLRGATVALLTACLCLSYNLESVSSTRNISKNKQRVIVELGLCISLPIAYICIHIFIQDHRFDLVQDFGCSSPVSPSTLSLVLIWIPPFILCIMSFVYSGLAVFNVCKRRYQSDISSYLESRSALNASAFFHRLAMSLITSIFLFVLVLVSIILPRQTSAQSQSADIEVVHSPDYLRVILLTWWIIPSLSLVHVVLSVAFGEETRGMRIWFQTHMSHTWLDSASLPTHRKKFPDFISAAPPLTPQAQIINLKSGWDDMLDSKCSKGILPRIRTRSPLSYTSSASSHTLSASPEPSPELKRGFPDDETFMASTISYLGSPVAQTLGLASPVAFPPTPPAPPSPLPEGFSPVLSPVDLPGIVHPMPEDSASIISSLWDKPWPQPPATVPSPTPSRSSSRTQIHPHVPPRPDSLVVPQPAFTKQSIKDWRRMRKRGSFGGYAPGEVIYMTGVQETV